MPQHTLTRHARDITGTRNGRLTAISCVGRNHEGRAMWLCACDCGGRKVVQSNNLLRPGGTKSCGCLRSEANARKRKSGGVWNAGKTYPVLGGLKRYRSKQAWAKAVIRHYGNECRKCGWNKARCDAHHRTPRSAGGANTIENGIVLCPNCHRVEHEGKAVDR